MSMIEATHSGELRIKDIILPCFVLEDRTRILSQRGVMGALRQTESARSRTVDGYKLPPFLYQNNLKPFISKELLMVTNPLKFRAPSAGKIVYGYRAEIMPMVCEVYLSARDEGALLASQEHIAKQAEILMRAFAHVGIIALIDEATGYQDIRDRHELDDILDKYLRPYQARWAKRFPDEFYKEIFRLKGWEWQGMKVNRPQVIGHYTNDIVYMRIAPGLLSELQRLNPANASGGREYKHHQWLTDDFGQPELYTHLVGVVAVMKTVTLNHPKQAWDEFMRRLQRAYPKKNMTFALDFDEDDG